MTRGETVGESTIPVKTAETIQNILVTSKQTRFKR